MPLLDVSEILLDPDFYSVFKVIRRLEVVSSAGRAQFTPYSWQAIGNVQTVGDNSLVREEAYSMQQKTIKVYTKFRLRGVSVQINGKTWQPDLVFWRGEYFLVKTVEDFSEYGAGFVESECTSFVYVGPPPQPGPSDFVVD